MHYPCWPILKWKSGMKELKKWLTRDWVQSCQTMWLFMSIQIPSEPAWRSPWARCVSPQPKENRHTFIPYLVCSYSISPFLVHCIQFQGFSSGHESVQEPLELNTHSWAWQRSTGGWSFWQTPPCHEKWPLLCLWCYWRLWGHAATREGLFVHDLYICISNWILIDM